MFEDIPFTNGKYSINEYGDVKRNAVPSKIQKGRGTKEKILKPFLNNKGYYCVDLRIENKTKKFLIHRLVAITFIKNDNNYDVVNHKDSNPKNNHVSNLEWCTVSQNNKHGYDFGNRVLTEKQLKARKAPKITLYSKVAKIDIHTDEIIEVYESMTQAAEKNGILVSAINNCCKGRSKTSYGYKWKNI